MVTPEEVLRMEGVLAFVWPVSWRYHLATPFGRTQQLLTVDAPDATGSLELSQQLGLQLWSRGLAAASSIGVELLEWDTVCWRLAPAALPMQAFGARGQQPGPSAGRNSTPHLVLETGYLDNWSYRRIPLPAPPSSWCAQRSLTPAGWSALLTIAEGLSIGLERHVIGGPYEWLIAYPELLPPTVSNGNGVGFRRVTKVRVCEWCDVAPLPSAMPWP